MSPLFADDPTPELAVWLLLHYVDEAELEIRVELSLPVEFTKTAGSERGFVTGFAPRLVLTSIPLAPEVDFDDDHGDEEIDIPVVPRASGRCRTSTTRDWISQGADVG